MEALLTALRAVAEPTRLRILYLCGHGELTVTELTRVLCQSQPRVSRHLKQMCEAGLLERHQEGAWAFFSLSDTGAVAELARSLIDQMPVDDAVLDLDIKRLATVRHERAARAQAYFSENAADWDSIRSLHIDDSQVELALRALVPMSSGARMLDVGTGTGRMLQLLAPRVGQAIGVDSSREMLALARANISETECANCSVRQADMYQLPWPDGSFDLAIAHMVLHFAEDPLAAVVEAARVLRADGRLLIVDFAAHGVEELRSRYAHRRLGFRPQEVEAWCAASAMTMRTVRSLAGNPLTVTIWEGRKLSKVDGRAENADDDVTSWIRGATL
ncbi:MAG: metalloregulator ArsR/SmtB family transcription factor [Alphaproteobacteria bacterium]|jgi:ubiquinone/menaquinone biosynthesis C-methylase UbiE/DNA-binding transcriptional ArsR family regulator